MTTTRPYPYPRFRLPCVAPNCGRLAKARSRFCGPHSNARRITGHETGRTLTRRTYKAELAEVHVLLTTRAKHPAVTGAAKLATAWLEATAAYNPNDYDQGHLRRGTRAEAIRLLEGGVTGLEIVTETAAVALFLSRNPAWAQDDRVVDAAHGRALMRLRPYRTRFTQRGYVRSMPQGPRLLAFGKCARQTFAHFCADVIGIFRKRWIAQQGALLSLELTDTEANRLLADLTSPRNS